ncbi:hypothetical protein BaRGS_00027515 [Batillaria attramentaria]|uniref:26S proteasome non-ATPase regulatory subunit 4 n=1 Tax=Batillaria attramentaria TaxID=370345 RepID=A0ABD0K322_9CAEN
MVLESTFVCVDNSDFMRNGDFVPTRMQAQQDAVNLVCMSKTRSNPENNVGLLKMSHVEVLVTLTSDVGRILARLHQVQPKGDISFLTAVRVAHLALKHRQGRNHKMRIVVFVGSPIEEDEKEIIKTAKKLKKEKVNVDIINFGEEGVNTEKLTTFVNTINGKDGSSSHLVTVPPGPMLSDALLSSPVIVGEDGSGAPITGGFEFGVDPNEDPELALALRVSMEEQRARQERDAREAVTASVAESTALSTASTEEAMLERALAVSTTGGVSTDEGTAAPMEVDTAEGATAKEEKAEEEDYSEVMQDPAFLQSVLENLPGVDPNSDAIRGAMDALTRDTPKESKDKDQSKKDGKK